MKQLILSIILLFSLSLFSLISTSFTNHTSPSPAPTAIEWLTVEQANQLMDQEPKKLLVNVSTDWCLPCKQMEQTTMKDPALAQYIRQRFYPVKFNAEMQETLEFNGEVYEYNPTYGRNGVHNLALYLTDGNMVYPTITVLDEYSENPQQVNGFQGVNELQLFLHYFGEDYYKSLEWDVYLETYGASIVSR